MKTWISCFLIFFLLEVNGQVKTMTFKELQREMNNSEAALTVFNFWATWCAPCVAELPHFEELYDRSDVKVYLVSLDFAADKQKMLDFVGSRKLKSEVVWLNEKDPDAYMPFIDRSWNGAIPATLFIDSWGKTYFHQKKFSKKELTETVNQYLN